MALWVFGVESLVDGEMLVLQGEDLVALDVREGYICGTCDQQQQQPAHTLPNPSPSLFLSLSPRGFDLPPPVHFIEGQGPYSH